MTELPINADDSPLRRTCRGRMIAGVASGLSEYFDLDVAVVRIAFVAFTLLGGVGIPLYAAAWLLIPEEGADSSVAAELLRRREAA
ncbi:MAG: PspC domain-containing protein [Acidimicrobiales bacterium]